MLSQSHQLATLHEGHACNVPKENEVNFLTKIKSHGSACSIMCCQAKLLGCLHGVWYYAAAAHHRQVKQHVMHEKCTDGRSYLKSIERLGTKMEDVLIFIHSMKHQTSLPI